MLLLGPRKGSYADESLVAGVRVGPEGRRSSGSHCDLPCDPMTAVPGPGHAPGTHECSHPSGPSHTASVLPHSAAPGLTRRPSLPSGPSCVLPLLDPGGAPHVSGHPHLPPPSFLGTPFSPCSSGRVWPLSLCRPCALLPSAPLKCWGSSGLLPLGEPTLLIACLIVSVIETSANLPV